MMMMMIKMIMTLIILMTIIMTLMMQEYSNIGFWRDSDVCSPHPTVTQKGKKCANVSKSGVPGLKNIKLLQNPRSLKTPAVKKAPKHKL